MPCKKREHKFENKRKAFKNETLECIAYISESKRAPKGGVFLKERKRLSFESKEKRCIRKGRHLFNESDLL